jgi:hypothetical protein
MDSEGESHLQSKVVGGVARKPEKVTLSQFVMSTCKGTSAPRPIANVSAGLHSCFPHITTPHPAAGPVHPTRTCASNANVTCTDSESSFECSITDRRLSGCKRSRPNAAAFLPHREATVAGATLPALPAERGTADDADETTDERIDATSPPPPCAGGAGDRGVVELVESRTVPPSRETGQSGPQQQNRAYPSQTFGHVKE